MYNFHCPIKSFYVIKRRGIFFLFSALLFGIAGCCDGKKRDNPSLAGYAQKLADANHSYNSSKWVGRYRQLRKEDRDNENRHWLNMGIELVRAGRSEEAIVQLDSLVTELTKRDEGYEEDLLIRAKTYLALAHLRWGEQQNCIGHHTASSCIVPIDSSAVYRYRLATENAIGHYMGLLADTPDDFESKYLLNLAYMTLGQYPDSVPSTSLIKNTLFDIPSKKWVADSAMEKGLAVLGLAGGTIAEDFNGDGLTDLMVSSWDMATDVQFFANLGEGTFEERSIDAGLDGIGGGLNMMQTDYNNDGWPDVFILRGGWLGLHGKLPNTLLRNNGLDESGKVSFTDVTTTSGLTDISPTQTAVWADFDNDGRLDVFVGNESAVTGFGFPSKLYMYDGDGTFADVAQEAGVSMFDSLSPRQYIIKGVAAADYNGDGWTDLFVSTRNTQNFLFRNNGLRNGIPNFEDVTEQSGLGGLHKTFSCWFWDYNNDGLEDLLVAGFHTEAHAMDKSISYDFGKELLHLDHSAQTGLLFKNIGDGTFENVTTETGLDKILYMMGGNFGDIDNDGWLDFYCGTGEPDLRSVIPNRMFRYNGKAFEEITNRGFGHIQKGHGTTFADFDGDGDQDMYMVVGGFYEGDVYQNIYLENKLETDNNHFAIQLQGKRSNSFGVGSRLKLTVADGKGRRYIYRTVGSGGSFGASSFTQHIGVGNAFQIDTLEIIWAGSGTRQVITDLRANRLHMVGEP